MEDWFDQGHVPARGEIHVLRLKRAHIKNAHSSGRSENGSPAGTVGASQRVNAFVCRQSR